jgi:hypothetical protein
MKRLALISLVSALLAAALPAIAQDVVSGEDVFVDLDQYAGKRILIEGGVYGADNNGAQMIGGAVNFIISYDGMDKATMRTFLKQCRDADGVTGLA